MMYLKKISISKPRLQTPNYRVQISNYIKNALVIRRVQIVVGMKGGLGLEVLVHQYGFFLLKTNQCTHRWPSGSSSRLPSQQPEFESTHRQCVQIGQQERMRLVDEKTAKVAQLKLW